MIKKITNNNNNNIKRNYGSTAAISRALAYGSRLSLNDSVKLGGLENKNELLINIKNLIITGCGTSLYAAKYGQRLMEYLNSFETVSTIDSGEIISDSFSKTKNVGLLAISQSGETKDVINALKLADNQHIIDSLHRLPTYCGVTINNCLKKCELIANKLYNDIYT